MIFMIFADMACGSIGTGFYIYLFMNNKTSLVTENQTNLEICAASMLIITIITIIVHVFKMK